MADDQVQDVKDRIDIVDLVGSYVPLKRAGANHKGLCPFHKERSPSFMVNPEKQIYKCFGCDEGGDVLSFVQKMEGLTFPEALELLADRAGITLDRKKAPAEYKKEKDEKSALFRVNAASAKFFHALLTTHAVAAAARSYLEGRGLTSETIAMFQVGYAPAKPVLGPWLTKHGFTPAQLKLAGSPERFRNRIMFPIRDALGNVVAFTGRAMPGDDSGPKYYNTPESPIFKKSKVLYGLYEGKQALKHEAKAVLVEGQVDVVLSHQAEVKTAVASSGTALTADHLRTLQRYVPTVLIAFDQDDAGVKAAKKAIGLALDTDLTARVVALPEGIKDAGEAVERDPAIWVDAVAKARPALDWLIESSVRAAGEPFDGTAKKAVAREVLPYLARCVDPVERAHYVGRLAGRLSIKESVIVDALDRATKKPGAQSAGAQPAPAVPKRQPRPLAEDLLGVMVAYPHAAANLPVTAETFKVTSLAARLYEAFQVWYTPGERQSSVHFLEYVKPKLSLDERTALDLLIADAERMVGAEAEADPATVAGELARRLHRDAREVVKQTIAARIAAAEEQGDRSAVKALIAELQTMLAPPPAELQGKDVHAKT
ncbi:MAG: DNA primase [Patescibacteria group bacterium]|jgi:DNA primase